MNFNSNPNSFNYEDPQHQHKGDSNATIPIGGASNLGALFVIPSVGQDEEEFKKRIEVEQDNVKILLKDLYAGADPKEVLSDQRMNEPFLSKFFEKYLEGHYKIETDTLSILLAGLYLALGDLEGAKASLNRIRNPADTQDDTENAGIHRAYYILQANLEIEAKHLDKARELLKKCQDIPHQGQNSFQDFYETYLGRIHLIEGKLTEAEKCFNEALSIRKASNNSRLISSSYNDLALLYIEKRSEQASEYLKKASEYDKLLQEELDNNKYDVLSGQVDLKRPDLSKTEEAYKQL